MNKNDCKVLMILGKNACYSALKSTTARKIALESKLCSSKVRKTLNQFIESKYVNEGMKEGNARSFYITDKGKNKLKEMMPEEEF